MQVHQTRRRRSPQIDLEVDPDQTTYMNKQLKMKKNTQQEKHLLIPKSTKLWQIWGFDRNTNTYFYWIVYTEGRKKNKQRPYVNIKWGSKVLEWFVWTVALLTDAAKKLRKSYINRLKFLPGTEWRSSWTRISKWNHHQTMTKAVHSQKTKLNNRIRLIESSFVKLELMQKDVITTALPIWDMWVSFLHKRHPKDNNVHIWI